MDPQARPLAAVARPRRARPPLLSIVKPPTAARSAQPTPEELLQLVHAVAQAADRQAFAVLFKHFAPRVKTYLVRGGADDELAEEVTQETMVALWRKAVLFDGRQAAVSTWVFTIARNLRVDRFRRQGGLAAAVADGTDFDAMEHEGPSPDEQLHTGRMEAGVRHAMTQLPAEQAEVLRLSFFEDQPHARIAEQLGIPLGTVKSRVRLAVAHLRKLLDGAGR
ncbi:MAG: sigma-70 family RNA polymerase sigma factor [Burkholderiaceae bacterium]|nr:sigma-70 family RNA polymerase sigma factor [Burkholderiaceae bacterium]